MSVSWSLLDRGEVVRISYKMLWMSVGSFFQGLGKGSTQGIHVNHCFQSPEFYLVHFSLKVVSNDRTTVCTEWIIVMTLHIHNLVV